MQSICNFNLRICKRHSFSISVCNSNLIKPFCVNKRHDGGRPKINVAFALSYQKIHNIVNVTSQRRRITLKLYLLENSSEQLCRPWGCVYCWCWGCQLRPRTNSNTNTITMKSCPKFWKTSTQIAQISPEYIRLVKGP